MTQGDRPRSAMLRLSLPEGERMEVDSYDDWAFKHRHANADRQALMERLARTGSIVRLTDKLVLEGAKATVARQRLLRAMSGQTFRNSWGADPHDEPVVARDLIEELFPWGTVPTLGGNPKAGKTVLVTNLLRGLVDPTFRFLGQFGPSTLTADELCRTIVMVNAETSRVAFEAELVRAGLAQDAFGLWGVKRPDLDDPEMGFAIRVHHLLESGGPGRMDLTDQTKFDDWTYLLHQCDSCLGDDDFTPVMVIVDNMTAILIEVAKGPTEFAAWYAQFRRLLRTCDVPNGLVVGHSFGGVNRLLGGVENVAGPDGLWSVMSDDLNDPNTVRRFAVVPRIGGYAVPTTAIWREAEGTLKMGGRSKPSRREQVQLSIREAVMAFVSQANDDVVGPTCTEIRGQGLARNPVVDAALAALVDDGSLLTRTRKARGGGTEHWLRSHPSLPPESTKTDL